MSPRLFAILLIAFVAVATAPTVRAQPAAAIAAIVNDEVISQRDVGARLGLLVAMSGGIDDPQLLRRLRDQSLKSLVDEVLQLQEATRKGVSVPQNEVDGALAGIAKENNVPPDRFDEFLRRGNIDKDTLVLQIKSEMAWGKLLRQKIAPTITISDEDVDQAIAKAKASIGQEEMLLAEIFLSVDSPDHEEDVRRTADQLATQIRAASNFSVFPALARQYSQGITAANGGDLGWVQPGTMSDDADKAIEKLRPGQITDPFRSTGGFYILALRERRKISGGNPDEAVLTLSQIVWPAPTTSEKIEEVMLLAKGLMGRINGCDNLAAQAREANAADAGSVGKVKLAELPPPVRDALREVPAGKAAPPLRNDRAISLYVVCAREEPKNVAFNPDVVRDGIAQRRLGMAARRYLRDLRRDAIIEYR